MDYLFSEEMNLFHCYICGSQQANEAVVNEIFQIEGKPILVEHIPAMVCTRCGEMTFSCQTTEQIRRMVHGQAKPIKSISIVVKQMCPRPFDDAGT